MFEYLYTLSDTKLFFLIAVTLMLFSMTCLTLLKHVIPLKLRYKDNVVIGGVGSIIGVIYGVLAGLMALYLINNINYATDAVQREASAAANMYRASQWLQSPTREKLQAQLKDYVSEVLAVEWPLMRKGIAIDHLGDQIINKMFNVLIQDDIRSAPTELFLQKNILDETKMLYDARQQRILMNTMSLSIEVWVVILIGTILTIAINYLFKAKFSLHFIALCAAALMASSIIFLLITLDRPFQGEFSVEPTALQSLLVLMKQSGL